MLTPIGTYNGFAVSKCVGNCDFRRFWTKTKTHHTTNFPQTTPPKTTTRNLALRQ